MLKYFGDWGGPWRVPTPVGDTCLHCGELIAEGDKGVVMPHVGETVELRAWHRECHLRQIVGSVSHVLRQCSCYGGTDTDDDPKGATPRQAARHACYLAGIDLS